MIVRPKNRVAPFVLIGAVCAALWNSGAVSQTSGTNTSNESQNAPSEVEAPPAPEPIRGTDIPRRAEATEIELRQYRVELQPAPETTRITDRLPETLDAIAKLPLVDDLEDHERRSATEIQILRSRWTRAVAPLAAWQSTLETRAESLATLRKRLADLKTIWKLTLDSAGDQQLPEASVERTRTILDQIEDIEGVVLERMELLVTVQDRISQEAVFVSDQLGKIRDLETDVRESLLIADSAPLWHSLTSAEHDRRLTGQARRSWRAHAAALTEYLRDYDTLLIVQISLFLALFVVLLLLSRRRGQWVEDEPALEVPGRILTKPFWAALLITLVAGQWLYPDPPEIVLRATFALSLLPVLGLLPPIVHPSMRRPLYILSALFFLDTTSHLAVDGTFLERLLILAVTIVALAGFGWLLRKNSPVFSLRDRPLWGAALNLARLAPFVLGVSLIANILGNISLAKLLTSAVIDLAFLGLVLFACGLVVDGLVLFSLRTRAARRIRSVRNHGDLIHRRISRTLRFGLVVLWLWSALYMFRLFEPFTEFLREVLPKRLTIGDFAISILDVVSFVLALWAAVWISRFIRFVLEEDVFPHVSMPRGVPQAVSKLTHYAILTIGFFIAMAIAGLEMDRFALVAGAFGVGIGFGLQNVVNNFVSGLILIFERPVQVGDTIEAGALLGTVRRIGIRSSTIRTFDGAEVIVPNANLISNDVVNWTLSDRLRRIEINVGVAYGTDPQKVLDLLLETARGHKDSQPYPEPTALFLEFGDSSLDFVLRFWTLNFDEWRQVKSDVTVQIEAGLRDAGIEIPFPQRDLHVRSVDPRAGRALSASTGAGDVSLPETRTENDRDEQQ